jgi:hypothetical protein
MMTVLAGHACQYLVPSNHLQRQRRPLILHTVIHLAVAVNAVRTTGTTHDSKLPT